MVKIVDKNYAECELSREIFKQEAIVSFEHYKKTGLHVTGDEVIKWLNSWGSNNVLPAPLLHK